VTITVALPGYLQNVMAFEVTGSGGEVPYPFKISGGKAVLKLDAIASGRMFVLRNTNGHSGP
jgi:hypothetical protein